jgi:hypothetical protein
VSFPQLVGAIVVGLIVALCFAWDQVGYRRAIRDIERSSMWAPASPADVFRRPH